MVLQSVCNPVSVHVDHDPSVAKASSKRELQLPQCTVQVPAGSRNQKRHLRSSTRAWEGAQSVNSPWDVQVEVVSQLLSSVLYVLRLAPPELMEMLLPKGARRASPMARLEGSPTADHLVPSSLLQHGEHKRGMVSLPERYPWALQKTPGGLPGSFG